MGYMNEKEENKEVTLLSLAHQIFSLSHQIGVLDKKSEPVNSDLSRQIEMLTSEMRSGFAKTDGKIEELEKRTLNLDEIEDLLVNIRLMNKRLQNEALGKIDITLTREEYDAASLAQGFPNRFALVGETE